MPKRREFYQRIGRKGGRATVAKYGQEHMSKIGRRGYEATTARHFGGDASLHNYWLVQVGLHHYWVSSGLTMKWDRNGCPIWPEAPLPHPAHTNQPIINDSLPF